MTWIDWLIVTIVVVSLPQGLRRGAGAAGGSAVGVVLAYVVASYTYASVAASFEHIPIDRPEWAASVEPLSPAWQATIAFLLMFLVASVVGTILAGAALGSLTPSGGSRLAGAAAGALRGVLVSAALLMVAIASPAGGPVASDAVRSAIAGPIAEGTSATIEWVNASLPPAFRIFGGGGARF